MLKFFVEPLGGNCLALLFGRRTPAGRKHLFSGADAHQSFELIDTLYIAANLLLIRKCMSVYGDNISTITLREVANFS